MASSSTESRHTLLEIFVQAHELANLDRFSLSDPVCVLYTWSAETGDWLELGRTEEVRDNLHPKWRTTFLVPYMPTRRLRFVVYDIDAHSFDLSKQEVIGEAVCTIADIHDAPQHAVSRRLTYLPRPTALRGSLVAVGVTIEEEHELTSIERLAILRRLAEAVAPGGGSFGGSAAVRFMTSDVISFKDDAAAAEAELDLFVRVGYLSVARDVDGRSVSKPLLINPVSAKVSFESGAEYTVNPYFLQTAFSPSVLGPSSAAMADAERSMHADRLVFVDEVEREYFLPDELRDSADIRFGKLPAGRDVPPVIAATLPKLIERVTYAKAPDIDLLHALILTFQSFATPDELLAAFRDRFNTGGTLAHESDADEVMVKFRVLNALKHWVSTRWADFADDDGVRNGLFAFCKSIVADGEASPPLAKLAAAVVAAYEKHAERAGLGGAYSASATYREDDPPPPLIPADFSTVSSIFDLDPVEVARQLTLMEHRAYCAIRLTELMGCAWSKAGKEEKSPRLLAAIEQFNGVSCLFRDAIVREADIGQRAVMIEFALKVAEACAALNNISSVMAIVASLSATPIHRLKKTWAVANSSKRTVRLRAELEALVSNESNFKSYRKLLNKVDPPAVPYLGMWLSDLTFLEDGNPDETDDGLINFAKFDLIARVLADVSQFQLMRYQLVPVDAIQSHIRSRLDSALDEEEAYRRSLAVEPRTRPTPDINQLADENVKLKDTIKALNRTVCRLESSSRAMEQEMSSLASIVIQMRAQLAALATDAPPSEPAASVAPASDTPPGDAPRAPSDAAFLRLAGEHHNRASQAILIDQFPNIADDDGGGSGTGDAQGAPDGGAALPASPSAGSGSSGGDDGAAASASASAPAGRRAATPVAHSGFLKKQSGSKASKWQKRWIVVRDGHVHYYKSQSDSKPAGVIVLHGCVVREVGKDVCGKELAFEIHHDQRRTYRFFAADEMERATWIGVIASQLE